MDNPVGHSDGLPERQEDEQRDSCSSLHTQIKETSLTLGILARKYKLEKKMKIMNILGTRFLYCLKKSAGKS